MAVALTSVIKDGQIERLLRNGFSNLTPRHEHGIRQQNKPRPRQDGVVGVNVECKVARNIAMDTLRTRRQRVERNKPHNGAHGGGGPNNGSPSIGSDGARSARPSRRARRVRRAHARARGAEAPGGAATRRPTAARPPPALPAANVGRGRLCSHNPRRAHMSRRRARQGDRVAVGTARGRVARRPPTNSCVEPPTWCVGPRHTQHLTEMNACARNRES